MALIWSVYWPTEDKRGPDLDKMNRVVEVDDEIARMRAGDPRSNTPGDGTARWPTDEELAAYHAAQQVEEKAAEVDDLTALPKPDLERMVADRKIEVGPRATKADLAAAIEAYDKQQSEAGEASDG